MLTEWQRIWPHLAYVAALAGLAGMSFGMSQRLRAMRGELRRVRRGREELEAYLRLDVRVARNEDMRGLAQRVCDVVAARSVFSRVALLTRDAEGSLYLAASVGMEIEVTAAIERWMRGTGEDAERWREGVPVGASGRVVLLNEGSGRAVVIPLTSETGRVCGALVVCAESVLQIPRRLAEEAAVGLEALAGKLARAMEGIEPARHGRVEKLAGKLAQSRSFPLKVMGRNGAASPVNGEIHAQLI